MSLFVMTNTNISKVSTTFHTVYDTSSSVHDFSKSIEVWQVDGITQSEPMHPSAKWPQYTQSAYSMTACRNQNPNADLDGEKSTSCAPEIWQLSSSCPTDWERRIDWEARIGHAFSTVPPWRYQFYAPRAIDDIADDDKDKSLKTKYENRAPAFVLSKNSVDYIKYRSHSSLANCVHSRIPNLQSVQNSPHLFSLAGSHNHIWLLIFVSWIAIISVMHFSFPVHKNDKNEEDQSTNTESKYDLITELMNSNRQKHRLVYLLMSIYLIIAVLYVCFQSNTVYHAPLNHPNNNYDATNPADSAQYIIFSKIVPYASIKYGFLSLVFFIIIQALVKNSDEIEDVPLASAALGMANEENTELLEKDSNSKLERAKMLQPLNLSGFKTATFKIDNNNPERETFDLQLNKVEDFWLNISSWSLVQLSVLPLLVLASLFEKESYSSDSRVYAVFLFTFVFCVLDVILERSCIVFDAMRKLCTNAKGFENVFKYLSLFFAVIIAVFQVLILSRVYTTFCNGSYFGVDNHVVVGQGNNKLVTDTFLIFTIIILGLQFVCKLYPCMQGILAIETNKKNPLTINFCLLHLFIVVLVCVMLVQYNTHEFNELTDTNDISDNYVVRDIYESKKPITGHDEYINFHTRAMQHWQYFKIQSIY